MRALQFSETGGPEVLHVAEVPEPHAGAGQVRVAVRAVAVNPIDFDTAGKGAVADLIELTGDPARVVTIADFGAGELGVHVTYQASTWHALAEAAELHEQGRTLSVEQTFPLEEGAVCSLSGRRLIHVA